MIEMDWTVDNEVKQISNNQQFLEMRNILIESGFLYDLVEGKLNSLNI